MSETDLLIKNARVLTLDNLNRRAGSVSVTNGRISGVWLETEPPRSDVNRSTQTEVIDLKGATLIPGFIDTHNHILMYAQMRQQVDCSSPLNQTISDIKERIQKTTQEKPPKEWILGYGYDDTLLKDNRHPTRADLDEVAPYHPVSIRHISGHLAVVNSTALRLAGLDDYASDPSKGGRFGRDIDGKLNGVLYEPAAMKQVEEKIPSPTIENLVSLLGKASRDYLAHGITTNTDAAVGMHLGTLELHAHLKAVQQGLNPMRMQLMVMHHLLRAGNLFGSLSAKEVDAQLSNASNGRVRLDSAKFFQDGSIQGLTGALREPYHCQPDLYGDLIHEQEAMNNEMLDVHKRGFRIATHGNGDRAIGSILDAYEFALSHSPRLDHRHRIEHVQTATIGDLDRMKGLGVAGSFFINHVYYWGDRHQKLFLGPKRARRISPLKDAIERELLFTLHSDCPITPISPLFSIWAAVNRVTRQGEVLGTEQCIDVENALKSMTIYGARLNFDEQNSGSIEVGKRADFAVLENDPTKVNSLEIKDIPITATIIDGRVVFENGI